MQKALFTSNKDDWRTPKWLFEQLDTEFHFNVDLCAVPVNDSYFQIYNGEGMINNKGCDQWTEKP